MVKRSSESSLVRIAELAGVSPGVVSVVLSDNTHSTIRVSDATRKRVRNLARELNYRPHSGARSARLQVFHTIAVVAPTHYRTAREFIRPLNVEMVDGINDLLVERNYSLSFLRVVALPVEDTENWPRLLSESCVDGLIIVEAAPTTLRNYVERCDMPAVWVNTNFHGDQGCIYYDEVAGARTITRYMLERGHRRIAPLMPPMKIHYSATDRLRGYLEEMEAWGVEPYPGYNGLPGDDEFVDVVRTMLERSDRPTAFLAIHEKGPRLISLIYHMGLRIPDDVSVIIWSNTPTEGDFFVPRLTTMTIDSYAIGRRAGEMILEKVTGKGKPAPSEIVKWELREGNSVCSRDQ